MLSKFHKFIVNFISQEELNQTDELLKTYSRKGLRTLVLAKRVLSQNDYD